MSFLALFAPGDAVLRLALAAAVQAAVVIAIAALVAGVFLRRRAAARHELWLATLVWVLLCPAIAVAVDRRDLTLRTVVLAIVRTNPTEVVGPVLSDATNDIGPAADPVVRTPREPSAPPVIAGPAGPAQNGDGRIRGAGVPARRVLVGGATLLWLTGMLVALVRLAAGMRRLARLADATRPLDPTYGATVARACERLGVAALPPVVTSRAVAGPVATGLRKARIVLPEGLAESLTPDELCDVLVHEGAHLLRRDPWVGLLQRGTAAVFWPHPLIHYLNAQLSRAREEVCDNFVLGSGASAEYARTLLALTELCYRPGRPRAALGLLGAHWSLADRVAGLVDPRRSAMTRATVRIKIAIALALAAAGLTTAAIRLETASAADEPAAPKAAPAPAAGAPETNGAHVTGIVVDENGRPVAGATVHLPSPVALGDHSTMSRRRSTCARPPTARSRRRSHRRASRDCSPRRMGARGSDWSSSVSGPRCAHSVRCDSC